MISRFEIPPNATPGERLLWKALRALTPKDSPTVKWKGDDSGVTAAAAVPPTTTARRPYRYMGVAGRKIEPTGTFSAATPFVHFDYENISAVWSAVENGPDGYWPPDTVILDGRDPGAPETYWHPR